MGPGTTDAGSTGGTTGVEASTSSGSTGGTTSVDETTGTTTASTGPGETTGAPAGCGDGMVEGSEQCDDGNQIDGDGCSSQCSQEALEKLYVFTTLGTFNGNIGGIAMADAQCQAEAKNNGLPGIYLAWLSSFEISPKDRFKAHDLPYVLPGEDEPVVAVGTGQLFGTNHTHPIDRGPDGSWLKTRGGCDAGSLVWTGTTNGGAASPANCNGFTNANPGVFGLAGELGNMGADWSDSCPVGCENNTLRLYCFQQP